MDEGEFDHSESEVDALQEGVLAEDGEFDEDPDDHAKSGDGCDVQAAMVVSLKGPDRR
jgi:hypothetical protein